MVGWFIGLWFIYLRHFQQYFSYIVAVTFIGGGNQSTQIKPGADPGFQVRGGALKKIGPSGGRREHFWGISCEKSRFYAKKSPGAPPPLDPPLKTTDLSQVIDKHLNTLLRRKS
jgi:hypothetical protein